MIKTANFLKQANYYEDELQNLLPVDQYGVQIVLKTTKGKTKNMDLNKQCFEAIVKFVKDNKLNH